MSRENRVGRDQRPPAARFAEIEVALDRRVLAALAAAWNMATERNLVAGDYWTREDVRKIADDLAEPITDALAAGVIQGLRDAQSSPAGLTVDSDAILDHIWGVIA